MSLPPTEVAREIEDGIHAGYPVSLPTWVSVSPVENTTAPLGKFLLDAGEAAVIQLAFELGIEDVCIDEWRGRRAAAAVGLRVTGSLGLLGRAKRLGFIESVRPWIDKLTGAGIYYHPDLLMRFISGMGE